MQLTEIKSGMPVTLDKGKAKFKAVVIRQVPVNNGNGRQTHVSVRRMGSKRLETVRPAQLQPIEVYWNLEHQKKYLKEVGKELERCRKALVKVVKETELPASVHGEFLRLEIPSRLAESVVEMFIKHFKDPAASV